MTAANRSTVDDEEVERFSALAAEWWNPRGKMAPLHKFNPVRIGYVRDEAAQRFGRDPKKLDSMKGLRMLDIGCGGGLLSEPLARLGASMTGVDPSETNIEAARPKGWLKPVSSSTSCWRWRWSSTWPMCRCSFKAARPWSSPVG